MSAFQQGVAAVTQNAVSVTITFPEAFSEAPDVVLTQVVYTGGNVLFTGVDTFVTAVSTTQATVKFSGSIPFANCSLMWVAGDVTLLFDPAAQMGFRASQLTELVSPLDNDYITIVHTSPTLRTMVVKWSTLSSLFGKRVSAPASPTASGALGQWAVDSGWHYTHDGLLWGRTPRQTDSWDWVTGSAWTQEGQTDMTEAVATLSVTFPKAFAETPVVTFDIQNVTAGDKLLLTGMLTMVNATGFTVTFNTAPDSGDYVLNWRATDTTAP